MKSQALSIMTALLLAFNAQAAIKSQKLDYKSNGITMEGYLVYDAEKKKQKRPAVIIVHDWMGLGPFTKEKADKLAKEGYVAFAVDVYGKGQRPKNNDEAAKFAEKYKNDRKLFRDRLKAAYTALLSVDAVNGKKIFVMGYCFGGTGALELARSGVPLLGTVSFHGGLSSPTPEDAKNIKGPVLVLHGAEDPNVPPAEVAAFKEEMKNGHVSYEFIEYPGAVHAFTNPLAGNDKSKGVAYNREADRESWEAFEAFLKQQLTE
ncbi:dienelactone hydrolase family protein [Candidatus Berkiella aquae]|uniref:Dienelactone hydrolase family protein n=1 Tax=Candidatus Berkiella aquae TaxID=295108 RepID=A0A0Q9YLM4_9GAMM|nr:dienelactone hydrolase family protein [Candidatus Berkiella aquae]MCS5711565.1 dienelactone hydrolase family protein [Candidatus Berkiella aquae]